MVTLYEVKAACKLEVKRVLGLAIFLGILNPQSLAMDMQAMI